MSEVKYIYIRLSHESLEVIKSSYRIKKPANSNLRMEKQTLFFILTLNKKIEDL